MKYLSPEYLGQVQAELGVTPEVDGCGAEAAGDQNAVPVAAQVEVRHDQAGIGVWTGTLEVFSWCIAVIGSWGVLSSLWGIWSLAYLESNLEKLRLMTAQMPELKEMVLMAQAQLEFQSLMMVCIIFKLIVSIGFIFGSKMLKRQSENANMFVVMVCSMAILYGLTSTIVECISLPDLSRMSQFTPEIASAATTMAVVGSAFGFLFRAAFYGGMITFMMMRNQRRLFAPKQATVA